ncbi:probable glutamine--tRNA ligase [Trichogramma pretiosum]|uniref:probable glutamine--tRNA ligase n=1 Tax=Trichogramma pretiosum TaxID=7493 RepID=UPI0006C9BC24|nr:probable glutamine--tRNA ligase [Trichogramma pretiosum]
MDEKIKLFMTLGLSEQKAKETLKNSYVTSNLLKCIEEVSNCGKINQCNSSLFYHLASKIPKQINHLIPFLCKYIVDEKIESVLKLDHALDYLLHNINDEMDINKFEEACGIGVIITPEQIEEEVQKCINIFKNEILDQRYRFNTGLIMQEVRNRLQWADGKNIKNEVDLQLFDLLGEKTEKDYDLKKTKKNVKDSKASSQKELTKSSKKSSAEVLTIDEIMKSKVNFHKPGENYKTDGYILTNNTKKLLADHLRSTGGLVITRFPPEPNGILHLGHAKAININFGYAAAHGGLCFLRYDDTNPEKEEKQFVDGIKDIVTWLGYNPSKITHSSDYFESLYDFGISLIKRELAYVCHQSSQEVKGFQTVSSPWRSNSVLQNLRIFQDMKDGLLNEGDATLRMKVTLEEGKQDPIAYRIKFSKHHKTDDQWCVYPTYDFTHCLCDSLENITHSLCTKEFQSRRSSYYWLCNALDIYCPVQWEYGRLNISYTVVSKRKISKLIEKKIVSHWDDPRLFTLSALRRRGFPAVAINNFCAQMGLTGAQTTVDPSMLEAAVRENLNINAPRQMVVLQPLKITIVNYPFKKPIMVKVPDFPHEPEGSYHKVVFDKIVYIDSSDFRESTTSNFKRLTINQSVGLKYIGIVLTVLEVERDSNGSITNIFVKQDNLNTCTKPRAFIQWVSQPSLAKIKIYDRLFQHKNPEDSNEVVNGYLSDVNFKSKKEMYVYGDSNFLRQVKTLQNYQFERVGFFTVDIDTKKNKVIFNRTATLKETVDKFL